jgi:arylsulfatase A-like enzyme
MTPGGRTDTRVAIGRSRIAQDIVVMTTHDIGRHLGCYGRGTTSPNLDAFAASALRFDQAFCTAPQCSPSRASLASGRYPHNNGVMGLAHRGFDWELDPPSQHIAHILGDNGFETHLFGSQHVSLHPERLGFAAHHHDADALGSLLRTDRRLYLEINFEETHRPYPNVTGDPPPGLQIPAYLPDGPEAPAEFAALNEGIRRMDEAAGRVLTLLEEAGRADDAVVVFTTDHGVAMPRAKCTLYDPGIEVVLLLRWPRGNQRGVRGEMVSNIDVLPTLLEAAGVPIPDGVEGRSLLEPGGRDAIFAEKTFHSYYDPMRCVRTHRHKLIRNFETAFAVEVPGDIQAGPIFRADPTRYSKDRPDTVELYDLEADPLELRNLAGQKEVADVERDLSARLSTWMRETDDPLLDGPVSSPRYRMAMEG